jgi:hypothetical protein
VSKLKKQYLSFSGLSDESRREKRDCPIKSDNDILCEPDPERRRIRHPRGGGVYSKPRGKWIPAFAGMTTKIQPF